MDRNVKIFPWNMVGYDESDLDGLEQNVSDWIWYGKKTGSLSSTWMIEDVDWVLEALEIFYPAHGATIEGLIDWPEDVIAKWSVESVSLN